MALTRPKASQINTVVTTITDPITVINQGGTVANTDVGFILNRNFGTDANLALFWDQSANSFVTAFTTSSGTTNANVTISRYANITASTFFGNIGGSSDSANTYVTGNFLPSANVSYDLGSPTYRWRTGYFAANTLDLGGSTISVDSVGFSFTFAGGTPVYLYGNSTVTGTLLTAAQPNITSVGNLISLIVTGNLRAGTIYTDNYFYANGVSLLSDLYSNAAVQAGNIATLFANAGAQAGSIATLTSNAAVQSGDIATIYANLGSVSGSLVTLTSNAAVQAGDIATLFANAGAQSGQIVTANTAMKGYVDAINSTLTSNAAVQSGDIATLFANAAVQAGNIGTIFANLGAVSGSLATLTSNAAVQSGDIATLFANAAVQAANIGTIFANLGAVSGSLNTLTSNAAAQAGDIATLFANAGAQSGALATLTSNAAFQSGQIASTEANITTANTAMKGYVDAINSTLTSNAAVQAGDIATLFANAGAQSASLATLTSNAAVQSGDIATLFANAGAQAGSIATLTSNAAVQSGDIANLYSIKANLASPSFTGNVNITGNLFVSGNMTVYNTNNISLTDGMIYLADGNSGNVVDLGFAVAWTDAVRYQHGGFVRDATDGVWKLFGNVVDEPTTTVNFTNALYQDLRAGNIYADGFRWANGVSILDNVYANLGAVSGSLATLTSNAAVQSGDIATLFANAGAQSGQIVTANTAMKGYVDGQISTTNTAISTANTAMKGYVDGQVSTLTSNAAVQSGDIATLFANAGAQSGAIASTNTAITTANTAMKGYVDGQVSTLTSNAAVQAGDIATLFANAGAQSGALATLTSNAAVQAGDIATLTANAAVQAGNIATLFTNAAFQSGQIASTEANITTANTAMKGYVDAINSTLTSNAAVQAGDIATLFANAGAQSASLATLTSNAAVQSGDIATLFANAAVQAGNIGTIFANLGAVSGSLATLTSNAAVQSGDIATLFANAGAQSASIATLTANAAVQSGDIATLFANAGAQSGSITTLNTAKANLSGATFTGSVTTTELFVTAFGGDEGGQINLANAVTNSSLAGNVVIDVFQNRLRIFEGGGTARGVFLDLTTANAGVGTNLLSGGGGGGGGTPGGGDTQLQFNDSSVFGGAVSLRYFKGNGVVLANAGVASTSTTSGTFQVAGGIGVTGNVWCGQVYSTNNGNGTNYRIGDDAWLGDVNLADTVQLMGIQNSNNAYIRFGNVGTETLGRAGSGALTWTGTFSAANINSDNHNYANGVSVITTLSTAITTANTAMKGYVDGQVSTLTSNAAVQAGDIATLFANAGAQSASLATLTSNAAVQAGDIATLFGNVSTLFANAGAQSGSIATLTSNAAVQAGDIATLFSNAAVQAGDIATLFANAGAQSGAIASTNTAITTANTAMKGYVDGQVSTLTSNAAVQAGDIATLFANAGAQAGSIATLTSNAAVQAGDIATLFANAGAQSGSIASTNTAISTANTAMKGYVDGQVSTLTSNAAVQAGDIATLFANAGAQAGSIATLTSNAAAQAGIISNLTGYANTNVAAYLPTYTGAFGNLTSGITSSGAIQTTNKIWANATTPSTSTTTGALNVAGGVGIAGNLNVGSLGEQKLNVITAQGNISIGNLNIGGTSDAGITFNGGGVVTSGIFTEVDGEILSYGINMAQLTTANTAIAGGIFRFDTRSFSRTFSVLRRPAGSAIETTALSISLDTGTVTIAGNVTAGNITAGGVRQTVSTSAPSGAMTGDQWYDTATDTLFQYINDGTNYYWIDISGQPLNVNIGTVQGTSLSITGAGSLTGALTLNSTNGATAIINGGTTGGGNIGSSGQSFNTVYAKASSAQYADLAEKYATDVNYAPGTVLVFGGTQEVTISTVSHDTRVAGVVTTNPGFIMNETLTNSVTVALTGRVPCQVLGPINKGDRLVASQHPGVAQRLMSSLYEPGCIIGKSLETIDTNEIKLIEIAIGRF